MIKRPTMVIHSSHGLAALVAGLSLLYRNSRAVKILLPQYLIQMQKPGQHVALSRGRESVVCFSSGQHPEIVEKLFRTARDIWQLQNFSVHYLREGRYAKWRVLLYTWLRYDWLMAEELRRNEFDRHWR